MEIIWYHFAQQNIMEKVCTDKWEQDLIKLTKKFSFLESILYPSQILWKISSNFNKYSLNLNNMQELFIKIWILHLQIILLWSSFLKHLSLRYKILEKIKNTLKKWLKNFLKLTPFFTTWDFLMEIWLLQTLGLHLIQELSWWTFRFHQNKRQNKALRKILRI